jgi:hypothetical protein
VQQQRSKRDHCHSDRYQRKRPGMCKPGVQVGDLLLGGCRKLCLSRELQVEFAQGLLERGCAFLHDLDRICELLGELFYRLSIVRYRLLQFADLFRINVCSFTLRL